MFKALLSGFGLTLVAELGDKTQIAIIALSSRFGFPAVFFGAALAFLVLNVLAVTAGALLYRSIPEPAVRYLSASLFVAFGILSLFPGKESSGEAPQSRKGGPFLSAFTLVALSELGDKTQLSLVALASKYGHPLFVFMGGTGALWLSSLAAAAAGRALLGLVPFKWVRRVSAVVFLAFGLLIAFRLV